eukprot:gb/GECG01007633.1/.p1 GENE.gb/GECG01007633.1/~~gb/GECG01007633.1/.p1  ORF type:complete len:166 (+),score=9.14 gb/GECG01007633.1/:1-498(+)
MPKKKKETPKEWKPIAGYEDSYQISNRGEVWSDHENRTLNPWSQYGKRRMVYLYKNGNRIRMTIDDLVFFSFHPQAFDYYYTGHPIHKDGRIQNDHIDNLDPSEWKQTLPTSDRIGRLIQGKCSMCKKEVPKTDFDHHYQNDSNCLIWQQKHDYVIKNRPPWTYS